MKRRRYPVIPKNGLNDVCRSSHHEQESRCIKSKIVKAQMGESCFCEKGLSVFPQGVRVGVVPIRTGEHQVDIMPRRASRASRLFLLTTLQVERVTCTCGQSNDTFASWCPEFSYLVPGDGPAHMKLLILQVDIPPL